MGANGRKTEDFRWFSCNLTMVDRGREKGVIGHGRTGRGLIWFPAVMGQQLRKRVKRKARERRIKRLKERARAAKAKA